jgi:hypothetical protein
MYDYTSNNCSHWGIVTRSLRKNLEAIPRKHSIDSLQKTGILGTLHKIRKVLQCETWSLRGEDHRWFKRSTRKKRLVPRDDDDAYDDDDDDDDNNNNNNNNNNHLTLFFYFFYLSRTTFQFQVNGKPVPVAARSKTYVCSRSPAGVVGSNSTGGMDVCLLSVLCVVR